MAAAAALIVSTSTSASAQSCAGPFSATLDQHVSAGRAQLTPADCSPCFLGICGFPTDCETPAQYTAVGSGEQLGQSGSTSVTLYESPAGYYSTTACSSCSSTELDCSNGSDDDCDGAVDCNDSDCGGSSACCASSELSCNDGSDNDCDGAVDCNDSDCSGSSACCASSELSCTNGSDDDCDGTVDCNDSDCSSDEACSEELNWVSVNGHAFISSSPTYYYRGNMTPTERYWAGTAVVNLPDGAEPRELECVWRNDHENLRPDTRSIATLFFSTGGGFNYSARLDLSGAPSGRESRSLDVSSLPPMDNSHLFAGIHLRLQFESSTPPINDFDFYGCRVGYVAP